MEPHLFPVTWCLCDPYSSSYSISLKYHPTVDCLGAGGGRMGEWDYGNESHHRRVTLPVLIYCLANPCHGLNDVKKQVPTAGFTIALDVLPCFFSSSARLYSFRVVTTTEKEELLVVGNLSQVNNVDG
ncbi:hypothetical protein CEXT_95051 [Caerostris extrusa]|uniref:Uncharacterized protein n=1 Tax=Caerostris extrusa TaxID=172846 RepID=A0AAV4PDC0_CAEEX|nr:hypothetical protein CEXT_95051 [Caerostris extrusa]